MKRTLSLIALVAGPLVFAEEPKPNTFTQPATSTGSPAPLDIDALRDEIVLLKAQVEALSALLKLRELENKQILAQLNRKPTGK